MKEMDRNVLSAAFHVTIPVLMGYLAIGMAFGLMMDSAGYNVFWALLIADGLLILGALWYTRHKLGQSSKRT